jgi:hypothetical protein
MKIRTRSLQLIVNHAHSDQVVEPVTFRTSTHTPTSPMLQGKVTTTKTKHTLSYTSLPVADKYYAPFLGQV